MAEKAVTVTIPASWMAGFTLVGAAAGIGASFIIGPVVNWLLGLIGEAPGPLRIAAALPLSIVIPVLCVVGICVGLAAARQWRREVGVVTISPEGVTVQRRGESRHIPSDQVSGAFVHNHHLVLVDRTTCELLRTKSEQALAERLRHGFETFGYPWHGTSDPHESDFVSWVDGTGPLDTRAHALLRARQHALTDSRLGAARQAWDELQALGISVRDHNDQQQYRTVPRQ